MPARSKTTTDIRAELLAGLNDLGPGGPAAIKDIVKEAEVTAESRVLVLGAGSGRAACQIAKETGASVLAAEADEGLFAALEARVKKAKLAGRIATRRVGPRQIAQALPTGAVDVVIREGALDFGRAIPAPSFLETTEIARLVLEPGGTLAVTQLAWIAQPVPVELEGHFSERFPGEPVLPRESYFMALSEAAFENGVAWPLPPAAWEAYYGPLRDNVARLRKKRKKGDPVFDLAAREIQLVCDSPRARETLGCLAFVVRKGSPEAQPAAT